MESYGLILYLILHPINLQILPLRRAEGDPGLELHRIRFGPLLIQKVLSIDVKVLELEPVREFVPSAGYVEVHLTVHCGVWRVAPAEDRSIRVLIIRFPVPQADWCPTFFL